MGRQNTIRVLFMSSASMRQSLMTLVRMIDSVLDLSWVYTNLRPHYPTLAGFDRSVLMIRMLIIGYVFGLRRSGCCARGAGTSPQPTRLVRRVCSGCR